MRDRTRGLSREVSGGCTLGVALLTISGSALLAPGSLAALGQLGTLLVLGSLVLAIVASYQFPIHIRHKIKMAVTSIPFYLLAALLPPTLAGIAAATGFLVAELSVRQRRGNPMSSILTHVGRFATLAVLD